MRDHAVLLLLSLVVLGVGVGVEGIVLNSLRPTLGLAPPVPWLSIATSLSAMFCATLLLVALLTWIATRWPSFAVPTAVGITGTVVGLILALSGRSDVWARLFPWSMPFSAVAPIDDRRTLEGHLIAIGFGMLGGLLVAIIGAWNVTPREGVWGLPRRHVMILSDFAFSVRSLVQPSGNTQSIAGQPAHRLVPCRAFSETTKSNSSFRAR